MTWVLTPVPSAMELRDLLSGLFGREVDIAMTDPFTGDSKEGSTFGIYSDDQGRSRAVAVLDLPASAYSGAAIAMMPAGGAEDAIAEGEMPQMLKENLGEVLNVMAALLNAEGTPHVKLSAVHHVDEWPEPQIAALAGIQGRRLDLTVTIPLYGKGRLSLVGVA